MDTVYQILLITDDMDEGELVRAELSNIEFNFELNIIKTREELESHLSENAPNFVISNYNLSNFSGIEALSMVMDCAPGLSFILIGKNIGEEKVVNALHQGASDYVNKHKLKRLQSVVKRELRKAKQLEKAKGQHTTVYESLLERTKEQACIYNISSLDEKQLSIKDLLKKALQIIPEGLAYPEITEAAITYKDQTFRTKHFRKTPWVLRSIKSDPSLSGPLKVIVTYTEKKPKRDHGPFLYEEQQLLDLITGLLGLKINHLQSEKDLQEKDQIIAKAYDLANIGHWKLDLTNQTLYWSKEIKRLHEVDDDFEPDLESAINFYKAGYHRQKIREAVQLAINEAIPFDEELKIVTAKGNERWIRAVGEAEFDEGQCQLIYGSTQNITTRKRAEEKYKDAEQKLRDILENSTNMFYRHDTDHVLTYLSPQSKQFLGYTPEEAKRRWTEFVTDHPINKEGIKNTQQAIDTGQTQPPFELQLQKKNGKKFGCLLMRLPL